MSRTDERPMIYTFIHIERSVSSIEVSAHYCVRNGNIGFRRATSEDWEKAGGHGAAARSKVVICRIKRRP